MNKYFPELSFLEENVKVYLNLSHYGTKEDLKNATGVDTSSFTKKN